MASTSSGGRQRFCPEPAALLRTRLGHPASAAAWQSSTILASTATAPEGAEKTRQSVSGTSAGITTAATILEAQPSGSSATTVSGNDRSIPSAERGQGATRSSSNAMYRFCSTREGEAKTNGPRCRCRGCNFGVMNTLLIGVKKEEDTQEELQFCSRHAEQARIMFGKSADDCARNEVDFVETHTTRAVQGSIIAPSFGWEGSNTFTRCLCHASAGMTLVGMTTCRYPGCLKHALDARRPAEADGLFCARHSLEQKKNVTARESDSRQDEATVSAASEEKSYASRHAEHGMLSRGKPRCGHPACLLEATHDAGGNVFERGKLCFCWRHSMSDDQAPSTISISAVSGTLMGPRGIIAENGAGRSGDVTRLRHMTVDLPRLKTDCAAATTRYGQHADCSSGAPSVRIAHNARLAPTAGRSQDENHTFGVGGVLSLTSADHSPSAQRARRRAQGRAAKIEGGGRSEKRARQHRDTPQMFGGRGNRPNGLDLSASLSRSSTDRSARKSGEKTESRRPGGAPSYPVPGITGRQGAPREAPAHASTVAPEQSGRQGQGTPTAMTAACARAEAAAAAGTAQRRSGLPSTSNTVPAAPSAVRRGWTPAAVIAVQEQGGGKLQTRRRTKGTERAPLILTPTGWSEWDWNFALCAGDGDIAAPEA